MDIPGTFCRLRVNLFFGLLLAGFFYWSTAAGEPVADGDTAPTSVEFLKTLSEDERAWLRDHPLISVGHDPDWQPVEFSNERGELSGMSGDYLNLVEQRLGVTFQRLSKLSWQEVYSRLKRWEIDMAPCIAETPERTHLFAFTKPYMSIPIVIATQLDVPYIADMKELYGKKVALVKGYAIDDWITKDLPQINLIRTNTVLEGLELLQHGEVFAYIDNLLIIGDYQAKMKVTSIKIAGQTPYINAQRMAVRKDWEPLAGILQKALESISETERTAIYRKWLPIRYEQGFDYILFWKALAAFVAISLALIFWNWKLAREIKARKQAEGALRESEERLRLALLAANQGLYDVDMTTDQIVVSPEYARMLGFDPDTFQETAAAWQDRLHPDEREKILCLFKEFVEGHIDNFQAEFRQLTSSGDWKWVLSLGKAVKKDKHGKPLRISGTHTDITERKQIETERLEMERRLLHSQKLESLGVLAGGIAHDFNNLLMVILGYADLALLEVSPVSPIRPKILEIIKASHRAADLCRQMLAYSGKGQFVIEHMYLNEVIDEMIHMLKTTISKKVLLNLNLEKMAPPIKGDPAQIRQVIMNLVINAAEAIGDKSGVVTVSTGARYCDAGYLQETFDGVALPEGLFVSLEVSDTGCGIDKETQSRIFEPFFTTKFAGRGLGMSAVLGIMRGHKGALKVYSEPGKGTTFLLLFPASADAGAKATGEAASPGSHWCGSGTVLLVDDEETVLAVGRSMLEKLGFSVITAQDGREAVTTYAARGNEIAFVVMDLTMPHMSGEEAFRELRRINPEVKVFISSGYSEWEITARFTGKSLAGFIQKPYQMTALQETLSN